MLNISYIILFILLRCSCATRNIVLIITDDQDIELGSMNFMPKTNKLIRDKGTYFSKGFVSTPICCPSRSSILSGRYVHNHNVHTNTLNCSGVEWRVFFEPRVFSVPLQEVGYRTAYIGKYLNEYEGDYVPPGWNYWFGLIKNSKFYNYTVNDNGVKRRFGADYEKDYFTDLITNRSVDFIASHLKDYPSQPFMLVLSYPAPHGPEDPAPKYADHFQNVISHRSDSWNFAPNPDKQWILQRTGKMEAVHVAFTDLLNRRRLQTLQSVDEGVQKIINSLRDGNLLSRSYIFYTSDHGYHLGQFGLIKGKSMPYEFDIRVPFFVRGPAVPRNITISKPVANIDLYPTFMDIAGIKIAETLDGRSILDLFILQKDAPAAPSLAPWRQTVLIERGKMPKMKKIKERLRIQKEKFSKEKRLTAECSKDVWQQPCVTGQAWRCYRMSDGRWRIYKCREHRKQCECGHSRTKRNVDYEDEFLSYSYNMNINAAEQWFQGVFEVSKPKVRSKRDCDCSTANATHPLKNDDSLVLDDQLFAFNEPDYRTTNKKSHSNRTRATCATPQMNCFTHTAEHWKTPPLWPDDFGQFCFCQNSNNNTYWCLRTVSSTEDFLYCEFVTGFISYYDMLTDPYQLTNSVFSLAEDVLLDLNRQLHLMKSCVGHECEIYASDKWKEYEQKIRIIT